jgi:hypothetical protein
MLQQHRLQKRESNYKDNIEMGEEEEGPPNLGKSFFFFFFWLGICRSEIRRLIVENI